MKLKPAIDHELIKRLDFRHPAVWLATWFGTGLAKPAPGTWGSVAALPFGIIIYLAGGQITLLIATAFIFGTGFWAARSFEQMTGKHDASEIVIDEVAGMWLTLAVSTMSPASVGLALLLFRFFDILKPWPVSWCDRKEHGTLGVMLDDIAAGAYAGLALLGIQAYAGIG